MLIERVEVVTGGASAAYGTDAVAGVANFILDTNFDGLKTHVQAGNSSANSRGTWEVGAAFGTDIGERSHLIVSGEAYAQDGVYGYDRQSWYEGWGQVRDTSTPGSRLDLVVPHVVSTQGTQNGIISAPGSALDAVGVPSRRHGLAIRLRRPGRRRRAVDRQRRQRHAERHRVRDALPGSRPQQPVPLLRLRRERQHEILRAGDARPEHEREPQSRRRLHGRFERARRSTAATRSCRPTFRPSWIRRTSRRSRSSASAACRTSQPAPRRKP